MKGKKGAINTDFLIGLIILVVAFVIILFFYYQYYWKGIINDETCHQSALTRHTFNVGPLETGREAIPLRCKTKKICIYYKEKECGFSPDKEVEYIKLESRDKEEIAKEVANQMFDSWTILGRGFLQIFHREEKWITGRKQNCITYSRIRFSKDIKNQKIDLAKFLDKKIPNGEISYWDYFAGKETEMESSDLIRIFDLRDSEVRKVFYENIDTNLVEYWVLYIEVDRDEAPTFFQFIPLPGYSLADLTHWINEQFTGESRVAHAVVLLPLSIEELSFKCEEFHELP